MSCAMHGQFVFCSAEEENSHKDKFNAGDMIMHHILDSYEWHIINIKDKHIAIPLPIIIYSKETEFKKLDKNSESFKIYRN